jgi:hypothetical protein
MKRILFLSFLLFLQENLSARLPDLIPYRKGNLWGYCDSTKKIIIEPRYDFAYDFSGGSAIVLYKGTQAIVDAAGNEILLPDSMIISLWPPHHGVRTFQYANDNEDYECGLVNDKGQIILEPINGTLDWIAEDYLFASSNKKGYKMAVYDFRGRQVLGFDYDLMDIGGNPNSEKGQFILIKNGKFGIVDTSGKVLTPFIYQYIAYRGCGYYRAQTKNSGCFLDENGKKVWGKFEYYIADSLFHTICPNKWTNPIRTQPNDFDPPVWFKEETANGSIVGIRKFNGDTIVSILNGFSYGFKDGLAWIEETLDKNTKASRDLGYIDFYGTKYWED